MSKSFPLVTIISPCYNHSRFVIESLNSIKYQEYPNIEHIIIDDSSTDNSAALIEEWIVANNHQCIFIKHERNQGISKTLNESIKLAKGVYWTPLATDDVMKPKRTSTFVDYLESNEEVNMVVSDTLIINDSSVQSSIEGEVSFTKYHTRDFIKFDFNFNYGTHQSLLIGNYIAASLMIRKSVFDVVGVFDSKFKMEDWDMWLKISRKSRIHYIDRQLSLYRYHGQNSNSNRDVMIKDHYKTINRYRKSYLEYGMITQFNAQIESAVNHFLRRHQYSEIFSFLNKDTLLIVLTNCYRFFKQQFLIRLSSLVNTNS